MQSAGTLRLVRPPPCAPSGVSEEVRDVEDLVEQGLDTRADDEHPHGSFTHSPQPRLHRAYRVSESGEIYYRNQNGRKKERRYGSCAADPVLHLMRALERVLQAFISGAYGVTERGSPWLVVGRWGGVGGGI